VGNPSVNKRQKEKNRQDKQRDKEVKRQSRREEKAQKPASADGVDPDIAGIIPGPQPLPDEDA
jgi:hypothetical protein